MSSGPLFVFRPACGGSILGVTSPARPWRAPTRSVDLGGHNENRSPTISSSTIDLG
jgi:hypothetical protein